MAIASRNQEACAAIIDQDLTSRGCVIIESKVPFHLFNADGTTTLGMLVGGATLLQAGSIA